MAPRPSDVLRSLAFYLAFYGGTVPFVFFAFAAMLFGGQAFRNVVLSWSRYHRRCVTGLLGIRIVVEGAGAWLKVGQSVEAEIGFGD